MKLNTFRTFLCYALMIWMSLILQDYFLPRMGNPMALFMGSWPPFLLYLLARTP
jgi:purine-cytosine permease-like protein